MDDSFSSTLGEQFESLWYQAVDFLPRLAIGAIVFVLAVGIAAWAGKLLDRKLKNRMDDPLLASFISKVAKGTVIVAGLLLALQIFGLGGIATGILAGAGLSAFVIGFAFKDIAENFLAGIILAFNRPFDIKDTVTVKEFTGQVLSLDLRTTKIKTADGKDIYIPNGLILKEPVINFTRDGLLRIEFVVGIDYDNNIDDAIRLITETLNNTEGVLQDDPPYATVQELATNTVNLKVYFWINTFDYKKGVNLLRGGVIKSVNNALLEGGFSMPANIQEIKIYKNDQPIPIKIEGDGQSSKE